MSNYEYIIASLPYLTMDFKYSGQAGFNSVISDIKRDLDDRDQELVEFLLKGFSEKGLDADFYATALRHKNRFLREYFRFDPNLRNAKVRYLNAQLGREPDQDVMTGEDPDAPDVDIDGFRFNGGEFEESLKVENILSGTDLVAREKGLDDILWDKIDSLSVLLNCAGSRSFGRTTSPHTMQFSPGTVIYRSYRGHLITTFRSSVCSSR